MSQRQDWQLRCPDQRANGMESVKSGVSDSEGEEGSFKYKIKYN
jgi:hypothetical protein